MSSMAKRPTNFHVGSGVRSGASSSRPRPDRPMLDVVLLTSDDEQQSAQPVAFFVTMWPRYSRNVARASP